MELSTDRIRRFPLFAGLPESALRKVAGFCRRNIFPKGARIVEFGEPADACFLVEYGQIKVYRSNPDGREQILHIVEGGQSFAEVAVLSLEIYPADALALEESAVIVVPKRPLMDWLMADSRAALSMLSGQARWIRRLVDMASALQLEDVAARLARFLVVYAEQSGLGFENGVFLEFNRKKHTIAAQIGTIPETLSRNLSKLEQAGLIRREGKGVRLLDAESVYRMAYPELDLRSGGS